MRSPLFSLLVAVGSLSAAPLAAQVPVQFGVMAGASFAKLGGSDVGSNDTRTGFVAGGFLRFTPAGMFALEPQLLYVQKGAKADFGGGITGTLKLDYVQVPVLIKLNIPMADKAVAPNIFVGPAIGFKASCKISASNGSSSASGSCADNDFGIKSTDFSAVFGAGLDIRHFSFQGRYDLGLTKLGDGSANNDVKNRAWLLTVGYAF